LAKLSLALGHIAARQDQMLVDSKMSGRSCPAPQPRQSLCRVEYMSIRLPMLRSPSLCSANQVMGTGAPEADAVFSSATPPGARHLALLSMSATTMPRWRFDRWHDASPSHALDQCREQHTARCGWAWREHICRLFDQCSLLLAG
jgi:hypothetical protein